MRSSGSSGTDIVWIALVIESVIESSAFRPHHAGRRSTIGTSMVALCIRIVVGRLTPIERVMTSASDDSREDDRRNTCC